MIFFMETIKLLLEGGKFSGWKIFGKIRFNCFFRKAFKGLFTADAESGGAVPLLNGTVKIPEGNEMYIFIFSSGCIFKYGFFGIYDVI